MNKKVKVIIATGAVLAVAIPVFACARKAPKASAKMIPTTETTVIEVKPTESVAEQKTMVSEEPGQIPEITFSAMPVETLVETQETEQKVETKKNTKKTKKTTKKTKKTTKKTKKPNKKTDNKTTTPKFTYGHSEYKAKDYIVSVTINKNNEAWVYIIHDCSPKDYVLQYRFDLQGKIDPKTGLFTYYDGSKVYYVKHPHVRQDRNEYLHGSGYITFNGNTLTWFDGVEHYADHVTFVKK